MKKFILLLCVSILYTSSVSAATLNDNGLYMSLNEIIELETSFVNENGSVLDENPNRAFYSDDEKIVTIDDNGTIYAQGNEGAAMIYFGVNGVEDSLKVIVSDNPDSFDADLYLAQKYLSENEIMVGDENGNFNHEKAMTRAEFAKIICKFTNNDSEYNGTNFLFTDVADDFWGFDYIMNAANEGLLLGYGNNIFGINDTLTEEQAITVLCRMLGDTYEDVSYIETSVDEKGGYSEGYISIAGERGIDIEGLQKAVPATRARVAKWLYQLYNIKNNY